MARNLALKPSRARDLIRTSTGPEESAQAKRAEPEKLQARSSGMTRLGRVDILKHLGNDEKAIGLNILQGCPHCTGSKRLSCAFVREARVTVC